jgi:hypothetical protein
MKALHARDATKIPIAHAFTQKIFVERKRPCCNANHSVIHACTWPSVLSWPALYVPNPNKISNNTTQISHIGKKESLWIDLLFCHGLRFFPALRALPPPEIHGKPTCRNEKSPGITGTFFI